MKCGAHVGQRALREHLKSQKCRKSCSERTSVVYRESADRYIFFESTDNAILASARYLVHIQKQERYAANYFGVEIRLFPLRPKANMPLLQLRDEALRTLISALKSGSVDVKLIGAIWAFGVAESVIGLSVDPHTDVMEKVHRFQEQSHLAMATMVSAFHHCSDLNGERPQVKIMWTSLRSPLDGLIPPACECVPDSAYRRYGILMGYDEDRDSHLEIDERYTWRFGWRRLDYASPDDADFFDNSP